METKEQSLESIGAGAMQAIACMVAALECDYERLAELREQKEDYDADAENGPWADTDMAEELEALEADAGDCEDREDAEQRIMEDPLSLEVRSDWQTPGEELTAAEFCLLLGTGGPAVRIIGDVNEHGELSRPQLQVQDWGTPWTGVNQNRAILDSYIACFCIA